MSSPAGNIPSEAPVDGKPFTTGWQTFFSSVSRLLTALTLSGTTAQRPTKGLYVGRPYFDTTLGFNINYNGTTWVNSAGTPV